MNKTISKIFANPLLSFVVWMLLLLTKYIIVNDIWGAIVEICGALIFVSSIVNWARKGKKKNNNKEDNNLKK